MKRKITPENEDFLAMKLAEKDIAHENKSRRETLKESNHLDDFFDDRNSTKQSTFYEEGDGAFEQSLKKTLRILKK